MRETYNDPYTRGCRQVFTPVPMLNQTPPSYLSLCNAMQSRSKVRLYDRHTQSWVEGMVNSIAAEDGGGGSWLVVICTESNRYAHLHVRTR